MDATTPQLALWSDSQMPLDTASVFIIGAGPTGLFLAYALTRQGISVRIIDKKSGPSKESRAMGVHARTLEFYRQFGLAEDIVALGIQTGKVHFTVNGRKRFDFSLKEMGADQSRYPFLLTLAQDVHERFLIEALGKLGISVEWQTELWGITQSEDTVTVTLGLPNGERQSVVASWLVGCDGASSQTRHELGIGFTGGTTNGLFYVADVETDINGSDIHLGIGESAVSVMMPVRTTGMMRLIGIVPKHLTAKEQVEFGDIEYEAETLLGATISRVNWFSTYRVHHRVAERFHMGRCFLAGDASHIHSPLGGQGMNTGLGDAMNLAWKLAHASKGLASPALLETYFSERSPFAHLLVDTTDVAFGKLTAEGWVPTILRRWVAPNVAWLLTRFTATKHLLFRTVSQIRINYRASTMSHGRAGQLEGGDRLPFIAGIDNHAVLNSVNWQIHVFGGVPDTLANMASAINLSLATFQLSPSARHKGFRPNTAYLVRPDGYIGLVFNADDSDSLGSYVAKHGLTFQS